MTSRFLASLVVLFFGCGAPPTPPCLSSELLVGTTCMPRCTADELWNGSTCMPRCTADELWNGSTCERQTPSAALFAVQPNLRAAGQLYVDRAEPGRCYLEGSMGLALSTYSQAQTSALLTGALPVGPGWFLVVNTVDGATRRDTCSSPFRLFGKNFDVSSFRGCAKTSGAYKPSDVGRANLTLGQVTSTGAVLYDCPTRGSLTLRESGDGGVTATVSALFRDGSSLNDVSFQVTGLF